MIKVNKTVTPKEINKLTPQYWWSKIKGYCNMFHIPQTKLAEVLGLSEQQVSKYNRNADPIKLETICKFCVAYNLESISTLEKY